MRYTIVSEKEKQSILEMHSRNKKAVNEDMVPNAAAPQATAQPVAVGPKPQVRTASEFAVMIGNMGYSKELMDPKYFTPLNVNIYAESDGNSDRAYLVINLNSKYKDENKGGTYIIK
jgi:hypothetical protein